jgi:hypothetical protein
VVEKIRTTSVFLPQPFLLLSTPGHMHLRLRFAISKMQPTNLCFRLAALPLILEHSEKIASAVALREFQNAASNFLQQSAQGPSTPSETDPGQAILSVVRAAGESISKRQVALADRDIVEVLYTRVSNLEA